MQAGSPAARIGLPTRAAATGCSPEAGRVRGGAGFPIGHGKLRAMSDASVLDLIQLRRGCTYCSVRQLCLPGGIGAEELQRLDQIVQRRRPIARGERLFRLGDPLTAVYVARDGAFKSVSISEDGEEQVLGFHLPGELIGLDAFGSGEHRCESVALIAANVCEVPYAQLSQVAAQVPGLQQQLYRLMGQSADRDQDHLSMLVRRQANERIALFLHSLGERYLIAGHSDRQYKLPMSREDIARFLGLALETVSRGFTRLQDDGVIAVTGRRVEIVDASALSRLAHHVEPGDGRQQQA
jgi:CRP/FNR family transcriptional regulator, anaerobic regulatory protein